MHKTFYRELKLIITALKVNPIYSYSNRTTWIIFYLFSSRSVTLPLQSFVSLWSTVAGRSSEKDRVRSSEQIFSFWRFSWGVYFWKIVFWFVYPQLLPWVSIVRRDVLRILLVLTWNSGQLTERMIETNFSNVVPIFLTKKNSEKEKYWLELEIKFGIKKGLLSHITPPCHQH